MQIAKDKIVTINYTLTDDDKKVLDSSQGQKPLVYLHGAGNIIKGLERELDGKTASDQLQVTVTPEDGYGLSKPELVQTLSKSLFEGVENIQVGMQLQAHDDQGNSQIITVRKIENDQVTIDANHPLAGQTLHFDVSVEDVRDAAPEELEHGHAH